MGRLEGQVAIISGAARGMGAATARLFVEEGASVVLTDISDAVLQTADALNGQAIGLRHDVTDAADWVRVVEQANDAFGPVDILVNNAGILLYGTIAEMPQDEFMRVINVNLLGTFLGMQAVAKQMMERRRGAIVNISSIGGIGPTNATAAYASSKAGVRGLTKTGALELGAYGVRVNSVHPGGIDTPMTNPEGQERDKVDAHYSAIPFRRAGLPDEIARATLYLASEEASYCNGTELIADGGFLAGTYVPFLPGGQIEEDS